MPEKLRSVYESALATNPHGVLAQPLPMLLLMLLAGVGLPFFAISAGAPTLQRWFSQTNHPRALNPYFLYQASNLASMVALIGYPSWFERLYRLDEQSRYWSYGYVALTGLVLACAIALNRVPQSAGNAAIESAPIADDVAPTWRRRLLWIFLTAGPSALLLGVTGYLTTNVAPIPLLWVAPLSLYLITYIIAFADRPWLSPTATRIFALMAAALPAFAFGFDRSGPISVIVPMHLICAFVVMLGCHSEVGRSRPSPTHLTEFYLWISLGGVLGGFFAAIVAPLTFVSLSEYPVALAACLVAIGLAARPRRSLVLDVVWPVLVGVAAFSALN
ncbi:MAG: hypothetical protein HY248_05895, partial [Fimbriimonas ginsengisoli]|nr:hypothetical protein [Fimbriimonas ginsengisoli]